MSRPLPLVVNNSATSPSASPNTNTPSGLGAYGMVSRPRFLSNQVNSPPSVSPNPNKASFRYRPSRPSLGYIFDGNHQAPPVSAVAVADSTSSKSGKKGSKSKSKTKSKNGSKSKSKNNGNSNVDAREQMRQINDHRKQSTLASFSATPNGQALDAIKRELEFLKKEVPSFESRYQAALASFGSTSHSKSRQIEFAFIQALSSWIVEEGAPAVKQFEEFKDDVQHEITGLVSTCEELSKQNQSLTIVISDLQQQNDEISRAYSEAQSELNKVSTELKDNEVETETQQLTQNDITDLSKDLEKSEEQRGILKEKVKRLDSYLKQSQKDNDDLNNRTYKMENELQQSKADIAKLHAQIATLEQRHEQELLLLAQAHDTYKSQMEAEQSQLVQIAEESQKQIQQMAANMGKPRSGTVVTPMFDDDYNANAPLTEDGGTTLDAEFHQYGYSEDEWLDDSDDGKDAEPEPDPEPQPAKPQLSAEILDASEIVLEPIREPTPPPFGSDFALVKESGGLSPMDPTKAFKMEKQKRTLELEDPTKSFANEKQSYGQETRDVTNDFAMERQKTTNDEEEKDATVEFESVKEAVTVDTVDVTKSWRLEKSLMEVDKIDPATSFVSEKQEHGVSPRDPTKHFASESQTFDLERADLSNTFVMETRKEIRETEEEKKEEMVYEKQSLTVDAAAAPGLELSFSHTDLSYTPKTSDGDKTQFATAKMSIDQPKEKSKPQYAYQVRHLRMDVDAVPPRITKIRKPPPDAHERPDFSKYYDGKDEIIRKSVAFQKIMAKWKKDEDEKGGKPTILVQREYELINRWNIDEKQKAAAKSKVPLNRDSNSNLNTPSSPSTDMFQIQDGNQRVTKTRHHKLKPKLQGFIRIVRCHYVPKYQIKKEMAFFCCLDGMPSTTNVDKNESDKDKRNDFLVPALFFFEKEEDFKQLDKEAGALPVRNAIFQKAFSRLAKGVITLHTHACDSSLEMAISTLEILKGRPITKIDKTKDTKEFTGKSMYLVNETDFHRFEFDDEKTRDDWLHKIGKLVMKRTTSVQRASDTYSRSHKESLGFGTPIQRASRASSKVTDIKAVENAFD